MSETLSVKDESRIESAVLRGIRLLDKRDPFWWNGANTPPVIEGMVGHIDLRKLDLGNPTCCVLAQRHESRRFGFGVTALFGDQRVTQASRHGFLARNNNYEYSLMTELWAGVIQSRRYPRRKIARSPFAIKANQTWIER